MIVNEKSQTLSKVLLKFLFLGFYMVIHDLVHLLGRKLSLRQDNARVFFVITICNPTIFHRNRMLCIGVTTRNAKKWQVFFLHLASSSLSNLRRAFSGLNGETGEWAYSRTPGSSGPSSSTRTKATSSRM